MEFIGIMETIDSGKPNAVIQTKSFIHRNKKITVDKM